VTADTVVARTDLPGKVFPTNVANQLSLLPEEVAPVMLVKAGDAVKKDQVIARTRGFLGIAAFGSEAKAPVSGILESISSVTGQAIFREPPIPVEVKAYVDGVVVEELPGEGVVVETEGAYVQGIFGLAGEVNARIAVCGKAPDQDIEEKDILEAHAGHVLIGGGRLTLAALKRAMNLHVAAIVTGGFAYQDIHTLLGFDIGVAVTGGEKIPTTLVVTEGFGRIAMARATYELLASLDGKQASVNGATQIRAGVIRPEIVVPGTSGSSDEKFSLDLDVGARVRCIRAPWFGEIGSVTGLPVELAKMPSETHVRTVKVQLDSGQEITLPRANVEVTGA
jgi:hypothetical protein